MEAERLRNQEAYARLKDELAQKHPGQFIVIAQGQLVAVGATLPEALRHAQAAAPQAVHRLIVKVGEQYPTEVRIGLRSLS